MRLLVIAQDLGLVEFRVDLRRGDAFMPEQFLNGSKVRPTFEQRDRVAVAENVGTDRILHASSDCMALDHGVNPAPIDSVSAVRKENPRHRPFREFWPSLRQVLLYPVSRDAWNRHKACLVPFAGNPHHALSQIAFFHAQTERFRNPQAETEYRLKEGSISKAARLIKRDCRQ